jgi:UDP-galactopyranose mutase
MEKLYDYLIVGAGLYGAVIANRLKAKGKKCLLIDKRSHLGGNIYCENIGGINVHKYGPHIFHTDNKKCWEFVCSFVEINNFIYSPLARYKDLQFNLPFNMNTFYQLWQTITPEQAKNMIDKQIKESGIISPQNLEEQALSMVGCDIYHALIKGYTEKQWGRPANSLPAFIINRIPLRFTYNNNYFNDRYQGIPIGGYNLLIEKLLSGIEVWLDTDFLDNRGYFENIAWQIIYTGRIDELFDYRYGKLEYRSLSFEKELLEYPNYQGNAAVNYTGCDIPYTRIVEHKHFEFGQQEGTVITKEYPAEFTGSNEPFYPINDETNNLKYRKYEELRQTLEKYQFGGRLGNYCYYDMDDTIIAALEHAKHELIMANTNATAI